jgi:hypothetical protein
LLPGLKLSNVGLDFAAADVLVAIIDDEGQMYALMLAVKKKLSLSPLNTCSCV